MQILNEVVILVYAIIAYLLKALAKKHKFVEFIFHHTLAKITTFDCKTTLNTVVYRSTLKSTESKLVGSRSIIIFHRQSFRAFVSYYH